MSQFREDSIFWIEIERVRPNPYQPRHEFDEEKLRDLAESIRQYGVLQPLVATRQEVQGEDGMTTVYELVAGERRLRAAKMAGLSQIPLIIRTGEDQNQMKLELAIIENLQREDLNPVDRARAFQRLAKEFSYKHADIAKRIGRSREYVSNTIRLLLLPQDVLDAVVEGRISEGHARSLLMLVGKTQEQETLFKEVLTRKLSVRDTESIARRSALERVRKRELLDPLTQEFEKKLAEALGTRVRIENREEGGKIMIDYFSQEELQGLLKRLTAEQEKRGFFERLMSSEDEKEERGDGKEEVPASGEERSRADAGESGEALQESQSDALQEQDRGREKKDEESEDLYSVKNFSI